jgi:integrase
MSARQETDRSELIARPKGQSRHEILGGKVQLFLRPKSPFWQCEASIDGVQLRKSTKTDSLSQARDVAEDWYINLKGKAKWGGGLPKPKAKGRLFRDAAAKFLEEYEVLTNGERSEKYVDVLRYKVDKHLNPFFGDKGVLEIDDNLVLDYRVHRAKAVDKAGHAKPPARTTIHHEIVALRHILKSAKRHGDLQHLPDLSAPYKKSGKVAHRAWFAEEEYQTLYKATRKRAKHPPSPKWAWECEQFHDFVLFMANTGLRPDEAARLEFRDVVIVDDDATDERILEIEVRGKRGVGYCKSMPGAVRPFERLRDRARALPAERTAVTRDRRGVTEGRRPYGTGRVRDRGHGGFSRGKGAVTVKPGPTDLIFGPTQRDLMNTVLAELDLKFDRDGQRRTAYSLRHTYICFRLMEGADIYQIAKNCRTSVEMIEKYYADHIKNMLDASAINVRRAKAGTKHSVGVLTAEEEDQAA